jgi:hypothetical protein
MLSYGMLFVLGLVAEGQSFVLICHKVCVARGSGVSPKCYVSDVTAAEVAAYRKAH